MFLLGVSGPEEHATKPRGNSPLRNISKTKSKVASNGAKTFDHSFFSGKRTLLYPSQKHWPWQRPGQSSPFNRSHQLLIFVSQWFSPSSISGTVFIIYWPLLVSGLGQLFAFVSQTVSTLYYQSVVRIKCSAFVTYLPNSSWVCISQYSPSISGSHEIFNLRQISQWSSIN